MIKQTDKKLRIESYVKQTDNYRQSNIPKKSKIFFLYFVRLKKYIDIKNSRVKETENN